MLLHTIALAATLCTAVSAEGSFGAYLKTSRHAIMKRQAEVDAGSLVAALGGDLAVLKTFHGKYLRCHAEGSLVDQAEVASTWEKWQLIEINGRIAFKAIHSPARFLRAYPEGKVDVTYGNAQAWELWTPYQHENGEWSFLGSHGQWLSAENDGSMKTMPNCLGWERFTLQRSSNGNSENNNGNYGSEQNQILNAHNEYRSWHGANRLYFSDQLMGSAQRYANELAARDSGLQHSDGPYGENLYAGYDAVQAIKLWYDEVEQYNFGNPGFSMGTGHFTQVVWKSSTHLGVGIAHASSGRIYVVAHYSPAGNVMGQFSENVSPRQ